MAICESFYEALDRRLEKRMTIDQIGEELCKGMKDSRRKVIRQIKEHKGEDWLSENAGWLGYNAQQALFGKQVIHRNLKDDLNKNVEIKNLHGIAAPPDILKNDLNKNNLNNNENIKISGQPEIRPKRIVQSKKIEIVVIPVDKVSLDIVKEGEMSCSTLKTDGIKEKKRKEKSGELEEIEICTCQGFGYLIKEDKWFILKLAGKKNKEIKSSERKTSTNHNCIFCGIELCPCGDFGYNVADDLWFTKEKILELKKKV